MQARLIAIFSFIILVSAKTSFYSFHRTLKIHPQAQPLFRAAHTGNKVGLNKQCKLAFKRLGLMHLLTPSGLHFSTTVYPIKRILSNRNSSYIFTLLAILFSLFSRLHAIRRVSYFYFLQTFFKNTKLTFFLAFILDILIGGFSKSPTSFALSFSFWGIILFGNSLIDRFYLLVVNQLIVCACFGGTYYILSAFFAPIISFLFTLIYLPLSAIFWSHHFVEIGNLFYLYMETFLIRLSQSLSFSQLSPSILCVTLLIFPWRKGVVLLTIMSIGQLNPTKPISSLGSSFSLVGKCKIKQSMDFNIEICRRISP